MTDFSVLISWLSILGILVGLFFPDTSLFWFYGKRSRTNVIIIYSFFLFLSILVFAVSHNAPVIE
ncbi:hypothetical protein ACMA1I_16735 [Pontibacter sp. 13R65]|uniref:hypothetical protein n=1 Tax=Pontibacter sp. 13R65 TaxID=3127458 RepID=UPI00301BF7CC